MNYTTKASMFRVKGIKPQSICIATRQGSVCSSKFHNTHRLKYRAKPSKHELQTDNRLLPNRSLNATKQHQGHTKKKTRTFQLSQPTLSLVSIFCDYTLPPIFFRTGTSCQWAIPQPSYLRAGRENFLGEKKEKTDKYLYRCFLFFFLVQNFQTFWIHAQKIQPSKKQRTPLRPISYVFSFLCIVMSYFSC